MLSVATDNSVNGSFRQMSVNGSFRGGSPSKPRLHVTESPVRDGPSPKSQVQQKKEQERLEYEANLRFRPEIPSSSIEIERGRGDKVKAVGSSSSSRSSRFDALYHDALKRRVEGPVLKSAAVLDSEATFKPQIPKRSRSLSSERGSVMSDDVSTRLHTTKGNYRSRPPSVTRAQQEEVFKPTISPYAQSLARTAKNVHERWTSVDKKTAARLKEKKAEVDAQLMQPCKFSPSIPKSSRSLSREREPYKKLPGPEKVADRLMSFKEELKVRKEALRAEYDKAHKATHPFKPSIPASSKEVLAAAAPMAMKEKDPVERLIKPVVRNVAAATAAAQAELTFRPKIPTLQRDGDSVGALAPDSGGKAIHERLHEEARHKRAEEAARLRRAEEERRKIYTFTPTVPPPPPSATSPESAQKPAPVFERLSTDTKQFVQRVLSQVHAEMEMEPCTFRPAVNDPLAEKRSYEGDVIDRLFRDNERNLWLIEQKREELLEAELSKLKPRPTIPETSIELAERKRKEGSPYGSSTHYVQGSTDKSAAIHDRLSRMHTTSSSPTTTATNMTGNDVPMPKVVVSKEASDAIVERLMAAVGQRKDEISVLTAEREEMFRRDETFSPTLPRKTLVLANKLSMKARAEAIAAARMQHHPPPPPPDSFVLRRVGSDVVTSSPATSMRHAMSPRFSQLYPGLEKQDSIPARASSSPNALQKNPMYISGKLSARGSPRSPPGGAVSEGTGSNPGSSKKSPAGAAAAAAGAAATSTPEWSPRAASGSPAAATATVAYKAVPAASTAYEPPLPSETSQFRESVKVPAASSTGLSPLFSPGGATGTEHGHTAVDDMPSGASAERRPSQKAMAMAALSKKGVPMSPATTTAASPQSSLKVPPPRPVPTPNSSQKADTSSSDAVATDTTGASPGSYNASLTPTYHI